jgi:hypothetical protein
VESMAGTFSRLKTIVPTQPVSLELYFSITKGLTSCTFKHPEVEFFIVCSDH